MWAGKNSLTWHRFGPEEVVLERGVGVRPPGGVEQEELVEEVAGALGGYSLMMSTSGIKSKAVAILWGEEVPKVYVMLADISSQVNAPLVLDVGPQPVLDAAPPVARHLHPPVQLQPLDARPRQRRDGPAQLRDQLQLLLLRAPLHDGRPGGRGKIQWK